MRKKVKGFTLIELVAVLGIISLMLGGFALRASKDQAKAQNESIESDRSVLFSKTKLFKSKVGNYPVLDKILTADSEYVSQQVVGRVRIALGLTDSVEDNTTLDERFKEIDLSSLKQEDYITALVNTNLKWYTDIKTGAIYNNLDDPIVIASLADFDNLDITKIPIVDGAVKMDVINCSTLYNDVLYVGGTGVIKLAKVTIQDNKVTDLTSKLISPKEVLGVTVYGVSIKVQYIKTDDSIAVMDIVV